MKRLCVTRLCVLVLLCFLALPSFGQYSDFKGIVVDINTGAPIPNVVVTDMNRCFFYGASDTLGQFNLSTASLPDSVQFVFMGYQPCVFNQAALPKEVAMKPISLSIEEAVVLGISVNTIVKRAADVWKSHYRNKPYLGKGLYTKTTQSNNKYIEFFQGMGYFAASGYTKPKKWDNLHAYFEFVPKHTRSSFVYAKAGATYKLEAKFTNRYNTGNREIFHAFRAVEAYGPLAPSTGLLTAAPRKYYRFQLDSVVHHPAKTYVVRFESKPEAVGTKLRIEGQGWMWIDAQTFNIRRYRLEHLNYMYVPFCNRKKLALPYLAQVDIFFQFFEGELFPKKVNLLKVWKHNHAEDIYDSFPPSRLNPGSNHLVVHEQFLLKQITKKQLVYDNVPVATIIKQADANPRLHYDKAFWTGANYEPQNWQKIVEDLGFEESLPRQFIKQDGFYYYDFEELPIGQYGTSERRKEVIEAIWQDEGWVKLLREHARSATQD